MRIVVTADLHYDAARSREPAQEIARDICRAGGDALVVLGDAASAAHEPLRECLGLFADFTGRKFLVPGNHCLWCLPGEDSIERYERIVPAIAAEADFAVLDHAPAVLAGVGLVGSIGWYDYSYRDEKLDIPLEFYRAKVSPGAAERIIQHKPLADRYRSRLGEAHFEITAHWKDGVHVRMDMSDEQFLEYLTDRLSRQLARLDADPTARQVVAFTHHLPFRQLVPPDRPPQFAFAAAFMGSDKLGAALLACGKLTHVYCGHSHWPGTCTVGRVQVVNVGSTYVKKRFEVLEL